MKLLDNLYFYPEHGPLDANSYVIRDKITVIVDVGSPDFVPALAKALERDGIDPRTIDIVVNTHLHGDHSWGNDAFKKLSGARVLCHPLQKRYWNESLIQSANFFGLAAMEFTEDGELADGPLDAGATRLEIIPTPGHSPDGICFYCHKDRFLICGDVIFYQNTGRVDLPAGNAADLKKSIEGLAKLDIEYLLPGHMATVTGADNVRQNFDFIRQHVFRWL
jgi:hydroxyacylglutathione hydrolase